MYTVLCLKDGVKKILQVETESQKEIMYLHMPDKIDYEDVEYIDFAVDYESARAGEDGYLVLPRGCSGLGDDCLCYFRKRDDCEVVIDGPEMIVYGMIAEGRSFMATVTGMTYDYKLVAKVENGIYSVFPRFMIYNRKPYENIEVRIEKLPDGSDYNQIAHAYRRFRVDRGELHPLKERMKERKALGKAVYAPFIRIRMGWKPVPTPVLEQTLETEPAMKTACTFEDVEALMEECKNKGINNAEFCLVGWNIRGHDGRWPQAFPVEPALGGEEKLKKLIRRAKELGYSIVCHTNSTDAYSIADNWNEEDVLCCEDGNISQNKQSWSGGAMYDLCPLAAYRQAKEILPKVAALGFEGLHYIDVISTVKPRTCYSQKHPVTARQCVEIWRNIMKLATDLFGGFSSEGGYDFAAPDMDYGLYVSFGDNGCPLADKTIPLWHLVYHGYVCGNPYTTTVNPDKEDWLKIVEYGGRPAIYFYSRFVTPDGERGNWMGTVDYACHTKEEREKSVDEIAVTYKAYQEIAYLQTEFMESHRETAPGIYQIIYSDGSVVEVDYNKKIYTCTKPGK